MDAYRQTLALDAPAAAVYAARTTKDGLRGWWTQDCDGQTHPWPGNVRQLENVIERAVALERGPLIQLSSLPSEQGPRAPSREPAAAADPGALPENGLDLPPHLETQERELVSRPSGRAAAGTTRPPSCWRSRPGSSAISSTSTHFADTFRHRRLTPLVTRLAQRETASTACRV